MADPTYVASLSEWVWSKQHNSYLRYLQQTGVGLKYIWPNSYRPTQQGSRLNEQPHLWPTSDSTSGPFANQVAPKSYEILFTNNTLPGLVRTSIPFNEIPLSSRIRMAHGRYKNTTHWILDPMRYFRPPSNAYTAGYCDHHACNDAYCIENQYRRYDWRDDLRHHEDQDKNGNMRDGDKVGEHCPPPPPTASEGDEADEDDEANEDDEADEGDEADEDDDYNHGTTTHYTGYYTTTPRYDPYSASAAGMNTAISPSRPVVSNSYYTNAYENRSQGHTSTQPYLYPARTHHQPFHAP